MNKWCRSLPSVEKFDDTIKKYTDDEGRFFRVSDSYTLFRPKDSEMSQVPPWF